MCSSHERGSPTHPRRSRRHGAQDRPLQRARPGARIVRTFPREAGWSYDAESRTRFRARRVLVKARGRPQRRRGAHPAPWRRRAAWRAGEPPFGGSGLRRRLAARPLPPWAGEIGCASWAQLLKFVLAHDAVTCAIPGTSNPLHMRDNAAAGTGPLPDVAMRERIAAAVEG